MVLTLRVLRRSSAMMVRELVIFCACLLVISGYPGERTRQSESASFWTDIAQDELEAALRVKWNTNVAKNVILFLGDGMGPTTVTAARILKGQLKNKTGEEEALSFETFPHVGLSKTYNTDAQISDSAGTATAYLCGVKTKYGAVCVDDTAESGDCDSQVNAELTSILNWSQDEGKSVGFVTTSRVTHASPAPLYARSASRNWEYEVPDGARGKCKDIATQLFENSKKIQVVLGGGRRNFIPTNISDPEYPDKSGKRTDGRNLLEDWRSNMQDTGFSYVWNKTAFEAVDIDRTQNLLGLFEHSHMQYESERANDKAGEPSLTEMVETSIRILQKNKKNGFFLMVEGGRIDHAHHDSKAAKALEETLAFEDAVTKAKGLTDDKDTLIVVTADHSHVMSMGGYTKRGNPILGVVDTIDVEWGTAKDGMPYTVLAYGNGPGFNSLSNGRQNLTGVNTENRDYVQQSAVLIDSETHGGEDVAIYASGPMAHLFHTTHEQNYIAHVMAYASCVGENKRHCNTAPSGDNPAQSSGADTRRVYTLACLSQIFIFFLTSINLTHNLI